MASNFIRFTIVGRLGRDPEMRYTESGVPVTNFTVAATRRWKDANETPQEKTTWVRVACWRNLAEVVAKFLQKGRLVAVEADAIEASAWSDAEGKPRATIEVTATNVHFLDSPEAAADAAEEDDLPL